MLKHITQATAHHEKSTKLQQLVSFHQGSLQWDRPSKHKLSKPIVKSPGRIRDQLSMEGRAIVHMPRLAMSMKKIRHLEFCCQIRKHFRPVEKNLHESQPGPAKGRFSCHCGSPSRDRKLLSRESCKKGKVWGGANLVMEEKTLPSSKSLKLENHARHLPHTSTGSTPTPLA